MSRYVIPELFAAYVVLAAACAVTYYLRNP